MMKNLLFSCLLGAILLSLSASSSNAQCQFLNSMANRSGNQVIGTKPPYFAMHPPVYYDRIVPRAYGISPFAAPSGVMPAENQVPVPPKSVSNPYFKKPQPAKLEVKDSTTDLTVRKSAARKPERTRLQPKSIANPFFNKSLITS